jgi:hypothetical protein
MLDERPGDEIVRCRKRLWWLVLIPLFLAIAVGVPSFRPDVYLPAHRHCIKQAGMALLNYADANGGRFPVHPGGYGDALLLAADAENCHALTGPGYDPAAFRDALAAGRGLPEALCGRVYVPGLSLNTSAEVVILFDKRSTPGGDHCHWPLRLWASRGREVLFRDGSMRFIRDSKWPEFVAEQTEELVRAGIPRAEVERLFARAVP